MARQGINTGSSPDAGDGDALLIGAIKINSNFNEVYTLLGDGTTLAPGIVTSIIAGTNVTVSGSTGQVTINASGSGGSSSQWVSTAAGIHTLSNVGIGTTNPTSALTVKGNTSLETLNVSGVSTLGTTNISGDLTFTGNNDIYLKDGGVINFGDGNDLQIFHNGSVSVIRDGGTGGLLIDSDNEVKIAKNGTGNDNLAVFTPDGSVELYYDNSKKFETLGAGVTVTGTTFTNQLSVSGVSTFVTSPIFNNGAKFIDNSSIDFGTSSNASLSYHTSSSSVRLFANNTNVNLFADNFNFYTSVTQSALKIIQNAQVELYYNNSKKFETLGVGVTVTGTTFTNQLSVSGIATFSGNVRVGVDTSSGVILTSPNGTQYRLVVDDSGTLSTVAV